VDGFSSVTQKGQVTIPADMRKALGLKTGSKVRFSKSGRKVILEAVTEPEISSLFGMLRSSGKRGVRDIDAALEELRHERYARLGKTPRRK
jgi:AbrB family looped-hinge helix DNA binding protein